jgi:hypothetical protein
VPHGHREGSFPLGAWLGKQRRAFRRGELGAQRIRLLEALAGWTWSPRDEGFHEGLAALETFVCRKDHPAVPSTHKENGFNFGSRVSRRRGDYPQGRLDAERIRLLEEVPGWYWRREDPFLARLDALRRYVAREGHEQVPSSHS